MQIHWTPGIGDPTIFGWLTVGAYFVAVIFCVACANQRGVGISIAGATVHRRFWWFMALALFLLGINKQLDLQTLITEIGKGVAKHQGWYEQRKSVQALFISGVVCGGFLSMLFLWRTFRNIWEQNRLALFGLISLVCFILIRAISFHGVDRMLGLELSGVKASWLLEVGGITFIWVSATIQLKRSSDKNLEDVGEKSIFL